MQGSLGLCILLTLQSHARPHFYSAETSFLGWMLSTAVFSLVSQLSLSLASYWLPWSSASTSPISLPIPFPAVRDKQVYTRQGFDLFLSVSSSQMSWWTDASDSAEWEGFRKKTAKWELEIRPGPFVVDYISSSEFLMGDDWFGKPSNTRSRAVSEL